MSDEIDLYGAADVLSMAREQRPVTVIYAIVKWGRHECEHADAGALLAELFVIEGTAVLEIPCQCGETHSRLVGNVTIDTRPPDAS